MNPFWYLIGYREYTVSPENATDFLNLCMCRGYPYARFRIGENEMRFCCPRLICRKLEAECEDSCIPIVHTKDGGVPHFIYRYRMRAGIAVGICIACILSLFLNRMIWDIRVTGNTNVSTGEVLDQLAAAGLYVGADKSAIDADDVELSLLLASDNLSWVSVNLRGTVAQVQVREKETANRPGEKTAGKPANIVAGEAGVIVYTEILRGNAVVTAGDTVSAGDLLISGVFDSTSVGFRWTRAAGHVYAQTAREFHVEVPLTDTVETVSENVGTDWYFDFFGKEIKVFKSTGNTGGNCDTIETVKEWSLPGGRQLPISVRSVRYVSFSETEIVRTPAQAEEIAYWQLSGQISDWIGKGSLLRKSVTVRITDDRLILDCTATGITDIAQVSEFDLDFLQNENRR